MASFYLISEYFELYYSFSGDCPIHFQLKRSTDTAVSVDLRFGSIPRVGMIAILIALTCINLHLRISSCSQDHDRRTDGRTDAGNLSLHIKNAKRRNHTNGQHREQPVFSRGCTQVHHPDEKRRHPADPRYEEKAAGRRSDRRQHPAADRSLHLCGHDGDAYADDVRR